MRTLDELLAIDDPAWPLVQGWIAESPRTVQVLPLAPEDRGRCLLATQVTIRSTLGALAWECGGLVLDHGWLRILGGGAPGLPDIGAASEKGTPSGPVTVGYDVLGGTFCVNRGSLPGEVGQVAYFAPDTLQWFPMDMGHTDFVSWALVGDTESFYEQLRWPGWEAESEALALDQGLDVVPALWSREAQQDLGATWRNPVPFVAVLDLQQQAARQLADIPDGTTVRVAYDLDQGDEAPGRGDDART